MMAAFAPMALLAACGAPAPPAPAPAPPSPAPEITVAPPPVALPPLPARAPVSLCDRGTVAPTPDGRLLNHFPYPDTPATALYPAPEQLGGPSCRIHPAMLPDLNRLLAAANGDPAVAGQLRAVSCHRGTQIQAQTFCGGIASGRTIGFRDRAWASAPPGHSEHSTGYVIDFGTRDRQGCPDADACFAATAVGKWLLANAPRYGFELSFPAGGKQGLKWEPWHWRWVGTAPTQSGAVAARATFARARLLFPADPKVD